MNVKKMLATSLVAFIVYFLLGWVVYDMILTDLYVHEQEPKMIFITLGCLFYGILVAYVVACKANATNFMSGAKVGAMLGFLGAISMNFFMYSAIDVNTEGFIYDVIAATIMVAITGGVVALVNKKVTVEE